MIKRKEKNSKNRLHMKKTNNQFVMLFSLILFSNFILYTNDIPSIIGMENGLNNLQEYTINADIEITPIGIYPGDRYTRSKGFAKQDNYIYSIIGFNPSIIDVSNKSNPTLVAEYEVPTGRMNTLTLKNELLFLGGSNGLEILNISNVNSLTEVGHYNTSDPVQSIILDDNIAYLAAEDSGLVIVNITNLNSPEKISSYNTSLNCLDIAFGESLVYIANTNETGNVLEIIDVSDPKNPTKIGFYDDVEYPDLFGQSITLNGSIVYLGTGAHGLFILNITDPNQPRLLGHYYGNTEQEIGVHGNKEGIWMTTVEGQYVFETVDTLGLYILDILDPTNPKLITKYTPINALYGAFFKESYLYLQDLLYGLMICEIKNVPTGWSNALITIVALSPTFILGIGVPILFLVRKRKKKKQILNATLTEEKREML